MRRILRLVPVAVGVVTLAGAMAVPAGAGDNLSPLTINKEVDGVVPPGTEFTVTVRCNEPFIDDGSGQGTTSATVDFDDEGEPDGPNTFTFLGGGSSCTVTETEDGDADDVSYECESLISPPTASISGGATIVDPCASHGPQEDPIEVFIVPSADQRVTVTVTNEFPDREKPSPAPAAQAVAVAPTFTG